MQLMDVFVAAVVVGAAAVESNSQLGSGGGVEISNRFFTGIKQKSGAATDGTDTQKIREGNICACCLDISPSTDGYFQ